jgi:glycosyltransferase involved in cell wall biosynthesis
MSASISVVMATFNGEKFIKEQLETIISQTIQPQEIIICDDCSSDQTIKIIESLNNPLIKIYQNSTKIGVVENFKKGVSLTKDGNFIALSDQDDVWFKNKLETLYYSISEFKESLIPTIAYSDLTLVDSNKKVIHNHVHNFETLLFGNFITGHSILMNSSMKKELLCKPCDTILHDVWIAFIALGIGKAIKINEPLAYYRQHEKNLNYNSNTVKLTKTKQRLLKIRLIFSSNTYLNEEFKIAKQFRIHYKKQL